MGFGEKGEGIFQATHVPSHVFLSNHIGLFPVGE